MPYISSQEDEDTNIVNATDSIKKRIRSNSVPIKSDSLPSNFSHGSSFLRVVKSGLSSSSSSSSSAHSSLFMDGDAYPTEEQMRELRELRLQRRRRSSAQTIKSETSDEDNFSKRCYSSATSSPIKQLYCSQDKLPITEEQNDDDECEDSNDVLLASGQDKGNDGDQSEPGSDD